jgi:hypothetical protein
MAAHSLAEVRAAKDAVKRLVENIDGVSGIGITWNQQGQPAVLVNVEKQASGRVRSVLSKQTLNVPVEIEEIGKIHFEQDAE